MNIFLWVLQILFAAHTAIGAVWKFSNSEQSVPSLNAIPHGVWMMMIGLELLCSVGLVLPAINKQFAIFTPIAAGFIVAEMLFFCGVHLASGDTNYSPMIYWLVVAALCGFIVFGRLVLKPF